MGLVRTNGLVFPKFVLHVLITKSFEVRGQDPVQQQDAPIQGADTRDVLKQHTATGTPGCACAKDPSVPAPLRSRLLLTASPCDLHPVWSDPKIRTFRKPGLRRRAGNGRGGGGSLSWRGLAFMESRLRGACSRLLREAPSRGLSQASCLPSPAVFPFLPPSSPLLKD